MNFVIALFIAISAFAQPLAVAGPQGIWRGEAVSGQSRLARHTVLLASRTGTCTGSVVSEEYILTAAHCLLYGFHEVSFGAGSLGIYETRPVVASISHPQYGEEKESGLDFDIALVRFSGGLPAGFSPATLAHTESQWLAGLRLQVAGYGLTGPADPRGLSPGLFWAELKINQFFRGAYTYFLALGRNQGACPGDSGGPVFLSRGDTLEQVGMVGRKLGSASCIDSPGTIVIAIPYFLPWLRSVTGEDL